MSKMFATVYSTAGRNLKEKHCNLWADSELNRTLIADKSALDKLYQKCCDQAKLLDSKFPRSKTMTVSMNDNYGYPYSISMGDVCSITIVPVEHEIE